MSHDLLPIEDDLAVRLETLFERHPALYGFTIQDCAGEADCADQGLLSVEDVSLFPAPGKRQRETICSEIAQTLIDFLSERPAGHELLRGRTVARVLH
jgi:hypothetical protein